MNWGRFINQVWLTNQALFISVQPKNSIYGKRANMKPPREKLRQRKESNNSDTDDVIMSAESALLVEQILEEEKVCSSCSQTDRDFFNCCRKA